MSSIEPGIGPSPAARVEPASRAPTRRGSPLLGALFMTVAALLFATVSGLVRHAADLGYHPYQIGFLRSLFAVAAAVAIVAPALRREGPKWLGTTRPGLFVLRGLSATIGVLMWMQALATMPMATATAISFTAPLFATAGSALILHEEVRARRWMAVVIGLAGVLIILRPGLVEPQAGAFAALIAALGMATTSLMVKSLTRTEPALRIVFYTSLILSLTTAIPAALVWREMTVEMWKIAVALGIVGAASHWFMTKAFEVADASIVLPFDYTRLPFAAAVGWLFFDQTSDYVTWIGALIITGSAFYVAQRERRMIQCSEGQTPSCR